MLIFKVVMMMMMREDDERMRGWLFMYCVFTMKRERERGRLQM